VAHAGCSDVNGDFAGPWGGNTDVLDGGPRTSNNEGFL